MFYPWKALSSWAPFEIDALGLLTLLGANEVDISVGRLAVSSWLEYMPLLAGFVFASDRFRTKQPAFTLYNISSGIVTSNLAAWFTRWIQVQDFQVSRSVVYWEVPKVSHVQSFVASSLISIMFTGFLITMTILSGDWYGFTNSIAIVVLIFVRSYMLQSSRNAINQTVSAARPLPTTFTGAIDQWEQRKKQDAKANRPSEGSRQWRPETAKVLIVLPDSRAVTMFIPEHLLRGVFVTESPIQSPRLYRLAQWSGWVAFTVHVVTLGMAHLATQLYVIALTVIPTVLISYGAGCEDSRLYEGCCWLRGTDPGPYIYHVGPHLQATIFEWPEDVEFVRDNKGILHRRDRAEPMPAEKRSTARQDLYAWLNLSEEEQKSMWNWHLLPHTRGHDDSWWDAFDEKKRLIRERPTDITAVKARIQRDLDSSWSARSQLLGVNKPTGDIEKGFEVGL